MAAYKRVLIKISGEALAAEKKTGFDFDFVSSVCSAVKQAADAGVQVGIVIGGGNFWRGVKDGAGKVERVSADRMGMLATYMNCLAVCDVFRQLGAKARVMTAVDIQGVGAPTQSCLPRMWTACMTTIPARIPRQCDSTTSPMTRCSQGACRSWTPRPRPWPWTTASPSSSSPWQSPGISCGSSAARPSAPWWTEAKALKRSDSIRE